MNREIVIRMLHDPKFYNLIVRLSNLKHVDYESLGDYYLYLVEYGLIVKLEHGYPGCKVEVFTHDVNIVLMAFNDIIDSSLRKIESKL